MSLADGAAAAHTAFAQEAAAESDRESMFHAAWAGLDDAELLAHFRSPREVRIDLIVDEDECTQTKIDAWK